MICQICGKKNATTHIKTVVNGQLTEAYLCEDCAREKGYGQLFGGIHFDFGNFLGGFLNVPTEEPAVLRCEKCGSSFEEISKTGKLGCAHCYKAFRSRILPVVQRIHGTARHKGKVPGSMALSIAPSHTTIVAVIPTAMEEKRRLLQKAIEEQNFEQAAVLRDEIKEMEQHG